MHSNNPKLAQTPGGFHNTDEVGTSSSQVGEHNTEEVGTSSSQVGEESSQSRSGKRKMTKQVESSEEKSLDELHREVFAEEFAKHLQKKKLELSIKKVGDGDD